MASEFGYDVAALRLDDETGEINQTEVYQSCAFTCKDMEAEDNCDDREAQGSVSDKTRFRVPAACYTNANAREKQEFHEQRDLLINGVDLTVLNTQNLIPIAVGLPTLLLFPAWTAIMCAISEASIHIYFHHRNRKKKLGETQYRSPFNLITSEFCAKCRTEKWMQQISKIQDKRSMRRNLIDPTFIKHVIR